MIFQDPYSSLNGRLKVKDIISEIENLNLKTVCHSNKPKNLRNIDIYIVDTFGETNKFHKIGSSVFLGGSIIKRGGQNPLEAARYGARIFHGPNTDNFKDIYKLLKSFKISKKISSPIKYRSMCNTYAPLLYGSKPETNSILAFLCGITG